MKLTTKRHTCPKSGEADMSDWPPAVTDAYLQAVDEAIVRMHVRHVVPAQEVVDLLLDLRNTVTVDATLPALVESASVS